MDEHCIPSAHRDSDQGRWAKVETMEPVMVESTQVMVELTEMVVEPTQVRVEPTQVRVEDGEAGDVARC